LTFRLAPELGMVVDREGNAGEAERLLACRAEQVAAYMRENLGLKLALARPPAA
jgi:hypothetical protein